MKINLLKMNNMKILKKSLLILCVAAIAISCDKDDDNNNTPVYQPESPLQGYLTTSGFNQETDEIVNGGDYEYGYRFRPTVTGAITAISVKIPDVNEALRVTIWDVATQEPIKTETFNVTSSGVAVVKAISPLALTKDKEYLISINSADYYEHYKTDNSNATYPISVGNIQITGYAFSNGLLQTFPATTDPSYYAGDVNFTFLRTL
jgi:uncharacterized protein DUF4082